MVAKSYQNLPLVGEPYEVSGRMYVKVQGKSGIKQIRWYNEREYAKMYPEEKKTVSAELKTQKEVLGFDKGYITIFKGAVEENEEWFKLSKCRYTRWWGWYLISTEEMPEDLPLGVEPVRLDWNMVSDKNDKLIGEDVIYAQVNSILYVTSASEYQGEVGERLELELTVVDRETATSQYGTVVTHIFTDSNDNYYTWKTSAKDWAIGETKRLRGTVKEHGRYKNSKATVLTRCNELK